ncbi:MAG TPA: hypothetical protein VE439_04415 [Anaerolineae bacterium]|nr:hypothetical protein [Anaerolineae bacterium]
MGRRIPFVALSLPLLTPGLGQLYNRQSQKAILAYLLVLSIWALNKDACNVSILLSAALAVDIIHSLFRDVPAGINPILNFLPWVSAVLIIAMIKMIKYPQYECGAVSKFMQRTVPQPIFDAETTACQTSVNNRIGYYYAPLSLPCSVVLHQPHWLTDLIITGKTKTI